MSRSHSSTLSSLLGPALAAAALSVFLASCTANNTVSDDQTSSVSIDDETSSAPMMQNMSSLPMMDQSSSMMMNQSSMGMMQQSSAAPSADVYKNGTYSATGNYRSPAGQEMVEVSVTLKDDVITNATFKGDATNPRSMMMQNMFAQGFQQEVVGQSIDSLSLGVVNGSSLTPMGFMDAVAKIKAEAKA